MVEAGRSQEGASPRPLLPMYDFIQMVTPTDYIKDCPRHCIALYSNSHRYIRGVRHLLKSCTRFRNQLDFQLIFDFKLDFSDFQAPEINGDLAKMLV